MTTLRSRTCYAVPHFGAVCSVACLEWGYWDNGSDVLVEGQHLTLLPFEIYFATEAKSK
ncbi:MAG TPA: hypothetical protein VFD00_10150 [Thermoclostridium sp.]|nr:hypothetical protein [Thermoclostridium sp.]